MTIKSSFVALGAMTLLALTFSQTTLAKSDSDNKKPAVKKEKVIKVKVKAGDTLTSIATKYKTNYVRLFNANKGLINPDILEIGDVVRIPGPKEKLPNRHAEFASQVAAASYASTPTNYNYNYSYAPAQNYSYNYSNSGTYTAGSTAGNTYYQGYCTWYAKDKRPDLPNMLGNGGQWTANAARQGFSTGTTPRAGAIVETPGHVAYVERVNADGSYLISEMNGSAGFGNVGTRTYSKSTGATFIYK